VTGGRGSAMKVEWFLKRCPKPAKETLVMRPELLAAQFTARTGQQLSIQACRPLPGAD
jgi:predicted GIY-YIG superfamily endonuclease